MALLLYLVEPAANADVPRPEQPTFGLAAALRLLASPIRPHVWTSLRASLDVFEPSFVLDLRDGGTSISATELALIVHAPGQQTNVSWSDDRRVRIGADEGRRVSDEIRRRGISLMEPGHEGLARRWRASDRPRRTGHGSGTASRSDAGRMVGAFDRGHRRFGAGGRRIGSQRAAALAAAAGAVFIAGPAAVAPEGA